jgi:MYXO-CTERM domain-containing protein
MPEVISKYPDVTKQVLESAGARCGKGEPQKILTRCPRESFCALPGGEVCVYGLTEVGKMTQIKQGELCPATPTPKGAMFDVGGGLAAPALAVLALWAWRRRRHAG